MSADTLPGSLVRAVDGHDYATIVEALRDRATRRPDDVAFVFLQDGDRETARLTYAQLDRRARTIAAALRPLQCAGKPVLLVYPQGLELVGALFGCLYAGALGTIVPVVVPQQAFDRAPGIARDAEPAALLTVESLRGGAQEHDALRSLPAVATDVLADDDAASPPEAPDPEQLAMLQYTSGTTTSPRGVMLSHANFAANLRAIAQMENVVDGRPMLRLGWVPSYHDMGLVSFLLCPVYFGIVSVMMPPMVFMQRPLRWLEAVSRYRATYTVAPSFAFALCVRRSTPEQRAALDLSCLDTVASGGEPVRADLLERFAEAFAGAGFDPRAFLPAYGMAETTLLATVPAPGSGLHARSLDVGALALGVATPAQSADSVRRVVCCGHAAPEHEVAIVDPGTRERMPQERIGEIWLRGPSVTRGYWKRREETAAVFDAQLQDTPPSRGWLRSGDLGFLGPEGLFVTGRCKDLIIVRGANHDPLDLEIAASQSHPALGGGLGAAFSLETADGESIVLACEVDRSAVTDLDAAAVTTRVAESVSRRFGLALHDLALLAPGALPRTTSGKIQRQRCKERYLRGELPRLADAPHPALGRWRAARSG